MHEHLCSQGGPTMLRGCVAPGHDVPCPAGRRRCKVKACQPTVAHTCFLLMTTPHPILSVFPSRTCSLPSRPCPLPSHSKRLCCRGHQQPRGRAWAVRAGGLARSSRRNAGLWVVDCTLRAPVQHRWRRFLPPWHVMRDLGDCIPPVHGRRYPPMRKRGMHMLLYAQACLPAFTLCIPQAFNCSRMHVQQTVRRHVN